MITVIGIDPGLVHTGLVSHTFYPESREVLIESEVFSGPEVRKSGLLVAGGRVFIEGYRPRSHYGTDDRMVRAVSDLHKSIKGSTVLNNTGVKKVIRQPLMQALGTWTFSTVTHHQDLRSASRIGLYGMVKDDELNLVLADFVRDLVAGKPWRVVV